MQRKFKKFISAGITLAMLGTTPCIPFASFAAEINKAMTISDIFIASEKTTVKIIKQPQSVTVAKGEKAVIKVEAIGDDLTYKWYYQNAGDYDYTHTSTFSGNTYTINSMDKSRHDRHVYCLITDKYGNSVETDIVSLSLEGALDVFTPFEYVPAEKGGEAVFRVEPIGGSGVYSYQWQYSYCSEETDGPPEFEDCSSSWTTGFDTDTMKITVSDLNDLVNYYTFRCIVTDSAGDSVSSDWIEVVPKIIISQQPVDVMVEEGEKAVVKLSATGENLTYDWYYRNPGKSYFEYTSTFKGNSYTIPSLDESRNGRTVYCIITDIYGNSVQSDEATISIGNALKIVTQPQSVYVVKGEKAVIKLSATGDDLTYKWYFKNAGASAFVYTSSFKGNSYTIPSMDESRNGRQVYCIITDKYGNSIKSDTVSLNLGTPLNITQQPQSVTVAKGQKAVIKLSATGDDLTYKWYFKNAGASAFVYTSSFKGNSYTIPSMDESRNGRQVYCVVTDKYGNYIQSETATLSLYDGPVIAQQPQDACVNYFDEVKFTLKATGDNIAYQWQMCNDTGIWHNVYNSSTWAQGGETDTFTFVATEGDLEGFYKYRCIVTDENGESVVSNVVRVYQKLAVSPVNSEIITGKGEKAVIEIDAVGEELTYKWYYKNPGSNDFIYTSSFKGNKYTILSMDESRNGRQVYCVITDKFGNSVQSETVTLTMINEVFIIKQPQDVICDENEVIKFTVEAIGVGALEYQWQYFEPALSDWGWQNIIGEYAEYGGCYTDTLVIDDIGYAGDCLFRCVITDENGNSAISESVRAWQKLKIVTQPQDVICDENEVIRFTVEAIGVGTLEYQWQYFEPALSDWGWQNIIDEYAEYGGCYTDTLVMDDIGYAGDCSFRCIITDENGNSVTSEPVSARLILKISEQPENSNCSIGQTAKFTVNPIGGSGSYSYQWQCGSLNGERFEYNNISTYSWASGGNTATLSVLVSNYRLYETYRCIITDMETGETVISDEASIA
ncbi:MAG: hypothetical protein IKV85_06040 [Ruminococcus sp.]|nr:hypothetical protein [Ruminococcus sp.]